MRKSLLFGLFSFLILALFSFAKPQILFAVTTNCDSNDSVCTQMKMFDQRRSGDQMNLETWYSGKAGAKADDPAGIGFSQIVMLDLYERISGSNNIDGTKPQYVLQKLIGAKDGKPIAQIPSEPLQGNGIIGQAGNFIALAFKSPPVSLGNYLAGVQQNMKKHGIVQPAYAQGSGFGFQNLLPILEIWKAFRNVAYFAFILVFILYGFMIMFRMKINPQNTASFQAAIPKIVMTLIIITFAYAIAGFMIDLMFVVFNLILSVFETSGIIQTGNPISKLMIQLGSGQGGLIPSFIFSSITSFLFVPSSLINVLFNLPGAASIAIDFLLTVSGLGLILRIIIFIAIGYSYMKLIFKLFEAYITVIIQVVFSPIILLQDVLPGSQAFGDWLRNIVANLSVFPTTMVMFLLSYIFMVQPLIKFYSSVPLVGGWAGKVASSLFGVNPLYGSTAGFSMPLLNNGLITNGIPFVGGGQVAGEGILCVIGFFIILMASKYVDMVRDALKVPPFKYGSAIGEALQMGWFQTAVGGSPFRQSSVGRSIYKGVSDFGKAATKGWVNPEEVVKETAKVVTPHKPS